MTAETRGYLEKARNIMKQQRYYESLDNVIYCDREFQLPKGGWDYMDEMQGFFQKQCEQQLLSKETKEILEYFKAHGTDELENDYQKGCIRSLQKKYERATKIPAELLTERDQFCARAQAAWKEAHEKADFSIFAPWLEKQFALQKRIAAAWNPDQSAYDSLLQQWDEGISTAFVTEKIEAVKGELIALCKKVIEKYKDVDRSRLDEPVDREINKRLADKAVDLIGFDRNRGTIQEVLHPVCVCLGPRDSRPTTNYNTPWMAVISLTHECGHGIYNYSSNEEAVSYGLWGVIEGMMHESQSRFYENMICRTKAFWKNLYPTVQKEIPKFADVPFDDFAAMLFKPGFTKMRIRADELTYNLHIIIRFEMERDYFEGKLAIEDFPKVWKEKYQQYLGVTPENDREGILQDVHWASGHVGYFQSYFLGDLYAAQVRHKLMQEIPDLYERIENGDVKCVHTWMIEHIYQYGQTYTPEELLLKVTGEALNPRYYIEYLKEKYE